MGTKWAPSDEQSVAASAAFDALSRSFVDVGCLLSSDGTIAEVLCAADASVAVNGETVATGMRVNAVFHKQVAEAVTDALERVFETGAGEQLEVPIPSSERRQWFDVCLAPVGEEPEYVVAMVCDVTHYGQAREQLQCHRDSIWEMLDSLDHMVYVSGADRRLKAWNDAVETTTGYTANELRGMDLHEFVAEEDHSTLDAFGERLQSMGTVRGELDVVTEDGRRIPHEFVSSWIAEPEGGHAITINRNVAEQERRQRELDQQRQVLDDIIDAIDDLFYIIGSDGLLKRWNESFARTTGYSGAELQGADPMRFFPPEEREYIASAMARVYEEGHERVESELVTKGGERLPYQFVANTFTMPDGETVICGIGRDISARIEREQQIGVFSRVLRHNIGNAMTVVFGQSEYIRRAIDGDLQQHLDRIDGTVENLLDISKKGRTITNTLLDQQFREPVRLDHMLDHAVEDARSRFPEADIEVNAASGTTVLAIPSLSKALVELLDNACEHNTAPTVTVSVRRDGDTVRLTVADDGSGVPPNEANIITQSAPTTPLYHGVGMGLWLVRWVVRQSGGTIVYDEGPDGGARFDIRLEAA